MTAIRDAQKTSDDNLAQMKDLVKNFLASSRTFNSFSVAFVAGYATLEYCKVVADALNDRVSELLGVSGSADELIKILQTEIDARSK